MLAKTPGLDILDWMHVTTIHTSLTSGQVTDFQILRAHKDLDRLKRVLGIVMEQETKFSNSELSFAQAAAVVANYNKEPERAVCDSVGYIRIPKVFSSQQGAYSFNIIAPSRSTPQSQKSDVSPDKALLYNGHIARKLDFDDPTDIFAVTQKVVASAMAEAPTEKEGTSVLHSDGPRRTHNVPHTEVLENDDSLQTNSEQSPSTADSSMALDMRYGIL